MANLRPQDLFKGAAFVGFPVGLISENFNDNWHIGRGLHNKGYMEQALPYLEKAYHIDPEHNQAHGRLIEIYLDIHSQAPEQGFDIAALQLSSLLVKKENTPYALGLHDEATGHVGLRGLRDGIHYNFD